MALSIKVEVKKNLFQKLARKLRGVSEDTIEETLEAMREDTLAKMQASSPPPSSPGQYPAIDRGNLSASLSIQIESADLGYFIAGEAYSQYLEFGTSRMAPRPFMGPAAELGNKLLQENMKKNLLTRWF